MRLPWYHRLPGPSNGQHTRRRIARHRCARTDRSTLPHSDRRDQLSIRADKDIIANTGSMLVGAIVIAGDRARTGIDVLSHTRKVLLS